MDFVKCNVVCVDVLKRSRGRERWIFIEKKKNYKGNPATQTQCISLSIDARVEVI